MPVTPKKAEMSASDMAETNTASVIDALRSSLRPWRQALRLSARGVTLAASAQRILGDWGCNSVMLQATAHLLSRL